MSKNLQKAKALYEKALTLLPEDSVHDYTVEQLTKQFLESLELMQQAADLGLAEAQDDIGLMYYEGTSLPKDFKKSIEFLTKSATQGYAKGQYNLGVMYHRGRCGLSVDLTKAIYFYRKAAEQGLPEAENNLAFMYLNGEGGLPKNPIKAVEFFQRAVEKNYVNAQLNLGLIYQKGAEGVSQDLKKAALLFHKAADQDDPSAQFCLYFMYLNGEGGLAVDPSKALEFLHKSAEQGLAKAQFNLAHVYSAGSLGISKDLSKAIELYEKAANQGLIEAKYNLATMYYTGEGTPADQVKAAELFKEMATQGDPKAQFNLGSMYLRGEGGLPIDPKKAIKLFQSSAAQGNKNAILGMMCLIVMATPYHIAEFIKKLPSYFTSIFKEPEDSHDSLINWNKGFWRIWILISCLGEIFIISQAFEEYAEFSRIVYALIAFPTILLAIGFFIKWIIRAIKWTLKGFFVKKPENLSLDSSEIAWVPIYCWAKNEEPFDEYHPLEVDIPEELQVYFRMCVQTLQFFIYYSWLQKVFSQELGDKAKELWRERFNVISDDFGDQFIILIELIEAQFAKHVASPYTMSLKTTEEETEVPFYFSLSMGLLCCIKDAPFYIENFENKTDITPFEIYPEAWGHVLNLSKCLEFGTDKMFDMIKGLEKLRAQGTA